MRGLGFESFEFALTTDRNLAIYAIILTGIWQSSGFAMALFLAGLRSVDQDLIKAAQIDGAGAFRTYRRVILPGDRADLRRRRRGACCSSPSRPSTSWWR